MRAPPRPAVEIADVVRAHGEAFRRAHVLFPEQHAVLTAIERCRTVALGGHLDMCTACGHERPSYNSCRNRHCPKCQALSQARWIDARMRRVLPTPYFHVVFTLPSQLREVARRNREVVFDLLFACASATLLELGRDPKRLGARLGITMVLHTWTRELAWHPHVHAIVTGGGLSLNGDRWVRARPQYFLPVQVVGALFRGKLLAALAEAHAHGRLDVGPDPEAFRRLRAHLHRIDWVVYAKRPFGGPEQVLRYLGRYTHRVGISNQRLVAFDGRSVVFRTKSGKTVTLAGDTFLARFLQHVLPPRFVKIRHYGLMAAGNATTRLELARRLLDTHRAQKPADPTPPPLPIPADWRDLLVVLTGINVSACAVCGALALERRPLPLERAPPRAA